MRILKDSEGCKAAGGRVVLVVSVYSFSIVFYIRYQYGAFFCPLPHIIFSR